MKLNHILVWVPNKQKPRAIWQGRGSLGNLKIQPFDFLMDRVQIGNLQSDVGSPYVFEDNSRQNKNKSDCSSS